MAYYAALNNVYNHYLSAYAPKGSCRYDSHKKSELRSIYNSMVRLNKESPLYLLDNSKQTQLYAIGLKENARQLRNTIASLGGLDEEDLLNKKVAYSRNNDMVSAIFIGEIAKDGSTPSFDIEVTSLASGQINTGHFLPSDSFVSLPEDTYSFDIMINDLSYEFQYNIREGETNKELQERLSRLISNADIGIKTSITQDGQGNSSLQLISTGIGLKNDNSTIFHVSDTNTSKQKGSVTYLGIDFVLSEACNAEFILNGKHQTAFSNHFTIDKMFEIELHRTGNYEGESARIGLKTDMDSLTENVNELIVGYNTFINTAAGYRDTYPKSSRLVNEMNHISHLYQSEFEKMGISYDTVGHLSLNKKALQQTALADDGQNSINTIRDFATSLLHKTNQVSLNPMQYVDKTIVAYKNPGHNFISPYTPSAYSGMMFNGYC